MKMPAMKGKIIKVGNSFAWGYISPSIVELHNLLGKEILAEFSYEDPNRGEDESWAQILIHDPNTFVVETEETDVTKIEEKYQAKFLEGKMDGGMMRCLMKSWGDVSIEVDVWNCEARIFAVRNQTSVLITDLIENGEDLAQEAVEEAGGSITMSGVYPPSQKIIEEANKHRDEIDKLFEQKN